MLRIHKKNILINTEKYFDIDFISADEYTKNSWRKN